VTKTYLIQDLLPSRFSKQATKALITTLATYDYEIEPQLCITTKKPLGKGVMIMNPHFIYREWGKWEFLFMNFYHYSGGKNMFKSYGELHSYQSEDSHCSVTSISPKGLYKRWKKQFEKEILEGTAKITVHPIFECDDAITDTTKSLKNKKRLGAHTKA